MESLQMDSSQMEALSSIWVIVQHQLAQINNSNNIAHIGAVLLNQLENSFRGTLTSWFQQHTGVNQVSIVRDIKARRYYIGPTDAFQESYQVVHIQGHGFVWLWDLQVDGQDASINSCNISAETAQNFAQLRLDSMAASNDVSIVGEESLTNNNGVDFAMLEDIGSTVSNSSSFPSPQVFTPEVSFSVEDHASSILNPAVIQAEILGANIFQANLIDPSLSSNQNPHNTVNNHSPSQYHADQMHMFTSNAVFDDTDEPLTASALAPSFNRLYLGGLDSIGMEQFHATLPGGALLHLSIPVDQPEDIVPTTAASAPQTCAQDKIPRPANAYILYRKDWHPIVKAAHHGIHNNDISKLLGKQWANETPEVRAEYKKLADEKKKEFFEKYPTYRYSPRRPSEIMRRNTKSRKTLTSEKSKLSKAKKSGNGVTGGVDSAVDKVCGIAGELSKNMRCIVWISLIHTPQNRYRITTAAWDSKGLLIGRVDQTDNETNNHSSSSICHYSTTSVFTISEQRGRQKHQYNAHGIDENLLPPALRGRTGPSKPPNRWILYRAAKSAELLADNPSLNASEISQVASLMWQAESIATKAEWEERAAKAREEHLRNTPEYAVAAGLRQRAAAEKKRQRQQKKRQQQGDGKAANKTAAFTTSTVTTDSSVNGSSEMSTATTQTLTPASPALTSDSTPVGSPRGGFSLMLDAIDFSSLF